MKKVLTIISLSTVGLLLIATIVLACIPVGSLPCFASPAGVVIYDDDLGVDKVNEDSEANNITSKMQAGVKQRLLQAIFDGTLKNVRVETKTSNGYISRSNSKDDVVVFEYKYNAEQTITVNGSSYEYKSIIFEINENDERDTMKMYLINDDTTSSSAPYRTSISVDGNFGDAFAYVKDLIEKYI